MIINVGLGSPTIGDCFMTPELRLIAARRWAELRGFKLEVQQGLEEDVAVLWADHSANLMSLIGLCASANQDCIAVLDDHGTLVGPHPELYEPFDINLFHYPENDHAPDHQS